MEAVIGLEVVVEAGRVKESCIVSIRGLEIVHSCTSCSIERR